MGRRQKAVGAWENGLLSRESSELEEPEPEEETLWYRQLLKDIGKEKDQGLSLGSEKVLETSEASRYAVSGRERRLSPTCTEAREHFGRRRK